MPIEAAKGPKIVFFGKIQHKLVERLKAVERLRFATGGKVSVFPFPDMLVSEVKALCGKPKLKSDALRVLLGRLLLAPHRRLGLLAPLGARHLGRLADGDRLLLLVLLARAHGDLYGDASLLSLQIRSAEEQLGMMQGAIGAGATASADGATYVMAYEFDEPGAGWQTGIAITTDADLRHALTQSLELEGLSVVAHNDAAECVGHHRHHGQQSPIMERPALLEELLLLCVSRCVMIINNAL